MDISHSRLLRAKIRMVSGRLDAAAQALWDHPQFPDVYPTYLFHNHAVVRASVPLMRAALARAQADFADDPVARALAVYLAHHIPEEMHHDDWLLDDLAVLGVDRASVRQWTPPPSVATLVGAQDHRIAHFHPVALLGYIAVLEGTPPVVEHLESLAARTRMPVEAFSTLIRHARLDPHHRDDSQHRAGRVAADSRAHGPARRERLSHRALAERRRRRSRGRGAASRRAVRTASGDECGHAHRSPVRALRSARQARRRRHGRGLPCARRAPAPRRRPEISVG